LTTSKRVGISTQVELNNKQQQNKERTTQVTITIEHWCNMQNESTKRRYAHVKDKLQRSF